MKPKEEFTKWLLLLLFASTYVMSEYFVNHEAISHSIRSIKLDGKPQNIGTYENDLQSENKEKLSNDLNFMPQGSENNYSNRRCTRTRDVNTRNAGNNSERVNNIEKSRESRTDTSRLTQRNLILERRIQLNRYSINMQRVRKEAEQRNLRVSDHAFEPIPSKTIRNQRMEILPTGNGPQKYFENKIVSRVSRKFNENRDASDTRGRRQYFLQSARLSESRSKNEERVVWERRMLQTGRFNREKIESKKNADSMRRMSHIRSENEENRNPGTRAAIKSLEKTDDLSFRSNSVLKVGGQSTLLDSKRRNSKEFRLKTDSSRKERSVAGIRREETFEKGQRIRIIENIRRQTATENRYMDRSSGNGRRESKIEYDRRERATIRSNEGNIRDRSNVETNARKERIYNTRTPEIMRESDNRRQELNQARRRNHNNQKTILDEEMGNGRSTIRYRETRKIPNISRHLKINSLRRSVNDLQSERKTLTERNNRIRETIALRIRSIEDGKRQAISSRIKRSEIKYEQAIRTLEQNVQSGMRSRLPNKQFYKQRVIYKVYLDENASNQLTGEISLLKATKNAENVRNSLFRTREKRDIMPARINKIFSSNRNDDLSRQTVNRAYRLSAREIEHLENKRSRSNWRQVDERLLREARERKSLTSQRNGILRKKTNNDLEKRLTEGRRMQSLKNVKPYEAQGNGIRNFRSNDRMTPFNEKNRRMFARVISGQEFKGRVHDARSQNGNNNSIMTLKNLELRRMNIKFLRNDLRIEKSAIANRQARSERNRELQRIRAETREIRKLLNQGNENLRKTAKSLLDNSRKTERLVMENPKFYRSLYRDQRKIRELADKFNTLSHKRMESREVQNIPNIQETARKPVISRRERNIETERNGRGFRGKTINQERSRAIDTRMQNDRMRNLRSRSSNTFQQKLFSARTQSNTLPNLRNGRGFRGKVERNALEIVPINHEFRLKTAHSPKFSSIINRKMNYLRSSEISIPRNFAQVSSRFREYEAKQRVSNDATGTRMRTIRTESMNPPNHQRQISPPARRINLEKRVSILRSSTGRRDSLFRSTFQSAESLKHLVRKDSNNNNLSPSSRMALKEAVGNLEQTQRRIQSQMRSRHMRSNNKELNQELLENTGYQMIRNVRHDKLDSRLFLPSLGKYYDPEVSQRSRFNKNSLRERKMRIILNADYVRHSMKAKEENSGPIVFQKKDAENRFMQVYSSALESVSMPGNTIFEKYEQHAMEQDLDDSHNYWDMSGRNAVSLLTNAVIGLLVLAVVSRDHSLKPKTFKDRVCDVLKLRS